MQTRSPRFAIERPMSYRVRAPGGAQVGAGRTLNISKRGVLFESDRQLEVGRRIDMVIQMGNAGGAPEPVRMHVQGVTVRNYDHAVAVSIKKYQLASGDSASSRKN